MHNERFDPLEVLRISTVVDIPSDRVERIPLEVLRISTVVDFCQPSYCGFPLEVLRISTVVDKELVIDKYKHLWKY